MSPPFDNPLEGQPSQSRLRRASSPKGGAECAHPLVSPAGSVGSRQSATGARSPPPVKKVSYNLIPFRTGGGNKSIISFQRGAWRPPFDNPPYFIVSFPRGSHLPWGYKGMGRRSLARKTPDRRESIVKSWQNLHKLLTFSGRCDTLVLLE